MTIGPGEKRLLTTDALRAHRSPQPTLVSNRGVHRRIAILEDGDHFGETALLVDVPRTATVRTLVPSIFLTLDRVPFLRALERAPLLRESLMRTHQRRQGSVV